MRILALVVLACLLAACVSNRQTDTACRYRERDLTVDFAQRTYWCIPGDKKGCANGCLPPSACC